MKIARPLLLILALIASPILAFAQPIACPQLFVGGQPPALLNPRLAQRGTLLCYGAYAVFASGVTHGAIWSAERPTTASLAAASQTPREGVFYPEDRLPPADRADLEDYRRSGFDRGHMTPAGDMPDENSQQQTFSLANVVPQTAKLNQGIWARIETAVRNLATRQGELYLVTGPAFAGQQLRSIGPNGVLVPSATWKAVFSPRARATSAYVCENTGQPRCEVVPVTLLMRVVGIDPFPALPAAMKDTAMALPLLAQTAGRSRQERRIQSQVPSWLEQLFGRGAP